MKFEVKEISNDDFKAASNRFRELNGDLKATDKLSYISFSIGSVNLAKFTFINRIGQKFYPSFCAVYFPKLVHNGHSDGGSLLRYDDFWTQFYESKLKPFEYQFKGDSGAREQPLYHCNLWFWAPYGLQGFLSSIELRDIIRTVPSGGHTSTPVVALYEKWIENNEVQHKTWINETMPSMHVDNKKYTF